MPQKGAQSRGVEVNKKQTRGTGNSFITLQVEENFALESVGVVYFRDRVKIFSLHQCTGRDADSYLQYFRSKI